jgi:hypothetical protein
MAKKKKQGSAAKPVVVPKKKGAGLTGWIVGAVAVVAVVAVITIANGGSKGATGVSSTSGAAPSGSAIPADEAKYIGRLLPAGFTEPSVAAASSYSSAIKMTDVTAVQDAKQISVAVSDVVANKIVYFEYKKAGSDPIPMIAYVKPSGKLWVGVSFCPPCKGKGQTIEADGTLRCEACGTKRDLETGVGISGACRLFPLDEVPVTVVGGKIIVPSTVLDNWTAQPIDRTVGA